MITTNEQGTERDAPLEFAERNDAAAWRYDIVDSPVGELLLVSDGDSLVGLHMEEPSGPRPVAPEWRRDPTATKQAAEQLRAYFAGELRSFDVPIAPGGTAFQRAVWGALGEIPYGTTATYRDIAEAIGRPRAMRPVGGANHHNPVAIIVPCHRVIGADGSLTGYGGGLERKALLLELERSTLAALRRTEARPWSQPSQLRMRKPPAEIGPGVAIEPSAIALASSVRSNQRTSWCSSLMRSGALVASASKAIMSEEGKGQGWEPR